MPHVEALFTGRLDAEAHPSFEILQNLRVTAHFVVERSGKINQFVAVAERAWHAGVSNWQGVQRCNDYSLGIEMIGDESSPFTAAQYRETARLCRALMLHFPDISRERIIGHSDVAPGRKWDPGVQWNWAHFHRSLGHIRNIGVTFR